MITQEDISALLAETYKTAALIPGCDMRRIADVLENLRVQLDVKHPFDAWHNLQLDKIDPDDDETVRLLIRLRNDYYELAYERQLTQLSAAYHTSHEAGWALWTKLFAEAAVFYREDLCYMLTGLLPQWQPGRQLPPVYNKYAMLVQDGRWPDVCDLYSAMADNELLDAEIRVRAATIYAQIILYYHHDQSLIKKYLELAKQLLPGHVMILRVEALISLNKDEPQQARNLLLQAIADQPNNFAILNQMGDCFKADDDPDGAASWYLDAQAKNCLETDAYKRLLNLYLDNKWFDHEAPSLEDLLKKIDDRQDRTQTNLLEKNHIPADQCATYPVLYGALRNMGSAWYNKGNMEEALAWYHKAVALEPNLGAALVDLGNLYKKETQFDQAKQYLQQALEKDADNFNAYWAMAECYEKEGLKEQALTAYNRCLQIRPDWNDWVYNFIGNMYYASKEYTIAESWYRKAINANNHESIYKQNLAAVLQELAEQEVAAGNLTAAENLYQTAAYTDNDADSWARLGNFYYRQQRWQDAITQYQKAISLNDEEPVYYDNLGLAYIALDKQDEAIEAFQKAADLSENEPNGQYLNQLGKLYYDRNDYTKAVEYFIEASRKEPQEKVYLENICNAYEKAGRKDEAEQAYLQLLALRPDDDIAMNALNNIYYGRGDYGKALEYCEMSIAAKPDVPVYYRNLGIVLGTINANTQAADAYRKALELEPDNAVNWSNVAIAALENGQYEEATKYAERALQLQPENPDYHETLARICIRQQAFEKALDHYQDALRLDPGNGRLLNGIGLVYYQQQQYDQAITYYQQAIDTDNQNWIYYNNLGLALADRKSYPDAIIAYQQALALKEDPIGRNELGVLYHRTNQLEKAADSYKQAIAQLPQDLVIHENLQLALMTLGRTAEARAILDESTLSKEQREEVLQQAMQDLAATSSDRSAMPEDARDNFIQKP
ncbi:tetratricopeptide repeat protein [Chitinophaga sp. 180180018-3]|uniref:tetratricopeptide repeat protein n=1 Tax=unclassified Chitinophaga TaxID=2619133 RepID=UPI0030CEE5E7